MNILALLLGWALGLFSPLIFRRVDRQRRGKELRQVIERELRNFRYMMAIVAHDFATWSGMLDDAFLADIRPAFDDPGAPEDDPKALEVLRTILALPPDQQNAVGQVKKQPGSSHHLVTYSLPFLDAHIADLDVLPLEFQRQLLDLRQHVDFFNQKVRFAMEQFALTFSPGLGPNHSRVTENIEDAYRQLARRARIICVGANGILQT